MNSLYKETTLIKQIPYRAMNIPNFFLELTSYNVDIEDLHYVRNLVFVEEQQVPVEFEFDELDRYSHHFIVRDEQFQPIGTGRLSPEGKIGHLAVLQQWRNQRVGESLLHALFGKARAIGMTYVTANAQLTALGFFKKFGFSLEGGIFMEAGIPHQAILLKLEPRDNTVSSQATRRHPSVQAVRIETLESALVATQQIIMQSRRQLCIYSCDLESPLYGQRVIVEAIKQFALSNSNSSVQIIIKDLTSLRSQAHPILELAQRLASYFFIRTPVETEDLQYLSAFVINDSDGYFFRLIGNRYEGDWSPNLPARNRQLREEFERVWQRSRPCIEFRVLGL